MPNQRKQDKKQIGLWLSPKELKRVEEAAARYNVNKSDLLKLAIKSLLSDDKTETEK